MAPAAAPRRQDADSARPALARDLRSRRRSLLRIAVAPPHLPGQPRAGLHAHVAGFRVVPAYLGRLDRDGRPLGIPLCPAARTRLFQVLRNEPRTQAVLRLRDGPAAAFRPFGRGAGMGQATAVQGAGHAPHDQTRPRRPHRPVGPVVHLSGASAGRKRHLRPLRRGGVSSPGPSANGCTTASECSR